MVRWIFRIVITWRYLVTLNRSGGYTGEIPARTRAKFSHCRKSPGGSLAVTKGSRKRKRSKAASKMRLVNEGMFDADFSNFRMAFSSGSKNYLRRIFRRRPHLRWFLVFRSPDGRWVVMRAIRGMSPAPHTQTHTHTRNPIGTHRNATIWNCD